MKQFTIRDLQNFVETARCRTLREAADLLGITQPSLSESLKRLEENLDSLLFYRTRQGINLTPAGRYLLEKAKEAVENLSDLSNKKINTSQSKQISLIVGCHAWVGSIILPKLLACFEQKNPGFRIEIRHALSRQIQFEIQSGSIDLGIVVDPLPTPDLIIKKVATDEVGVWASQKLQNTDRVICDPDLFQTKLILKKWDHHPKNILSSSNLDLCARLTCAGLGYGILPNSIVKFMGLDCVKVPGTFVSKNEIHVLYKPSLGRTPYAKEFIAALKQTSAELY